MTKSRKKNSAEQRFVRRIKKDVSANQYKGRRSAEKKSAEPPSLEYPVRLNRFIARAGVCSRREADMLIESGAVTVDGVVIETLGTRLLEGQQVAVKGKRIVPAKHAYILLNKPQDTITTASDERGRATVLDLIERDDLKDIGMFPVGRLDRHTRGALLISNDGNLAHRLMHPKFEIEKIYRVTTARPVSDEQLDTLREGVLLDDGPAKADRVDRIEGSDGCEIGISIHEGRNRQIRRMFEKLGHDVKRLERVWYAGLSTVGIRPGKWRFLTEKEILKLYKLVDL